MPLLLVLARSTGTARAALVAACTALVTSLLLVAVAVLRLPDQPVEALFNVVADPGVRLGTVLAIGLLALQPLFLLHQAVRLGTSARERRLAGLRLAGATPRDVRLVAAVEVGVPALAGGLAGVVLYGGLRAVLGGVDPRVEPGFDPDSGLHLVPTTVEPSAWQLAAVVLGVTVLGGLVGWCGSPGLIVSPLGIVRRQPRRRPGPWGAVLLLLAVVMLRAPAPLRSIAEPTSTGYGVTMVALAVLGMTGLASSSAYWTGRVAARRASSAPALMAARRLVTDPRPAGRAAAAVGGIALVSGGTGVLVAGAMSAYGDHEFIVSLWLVAVALLAALAVVVGSLAVHSTETTLDSKRSMAALVAQGASIADLARSQLWELLLAAVPVTVLGVLLGSVTVALVAGGGSITVAALVVLLNLVLTPALVVLAALVATVITRPLVRRAADPENLRTA